LGLHDLNHAQQFSHQAIMLQQGEVVASGRVDDVFTAERISDVYQTPITRVQVNDQTLLWPCTKAVSDEPLLEQQVLQ